MKEPKTPQEILQYSLTESKRFLRINEEKRAHCQSEVNDYDERIAVLNMEVMRVTVFMQKQGWPIEVEKEKVDVRKT